MHYPLTGLVWTELLTGSWGSELEEQDSHGGNIKMKMPSLYSDRMLFCCEKEPLGGQEGKSQLRGDWASFLQVTYLAFNLKSGSLRTVTKHH